MEAVSDKLVTAEADKAAIENEKNKLEKLRNRLSLTEKNFGKQFEKNEKKITNLLRISDIL